MSDFLHNVYTYSTNSLSTCSLENFTYFVMNQQTLIGVLIVFTLVQRDVTNVGATNERQ